MKTFTCRCGGVLFFENTTCLKCQSPVGWCPACEAIRALNIDDSGKVTCGHAKCGRSLVKCHNYAVENVCNRCTVLETDDVPNPLPLCDYCTFNATIPDLTVPANRERWYRLEVAKRRLLYSLDLLGLPYGDHDDDEYALPLSFDFMADAEPTESGWRPLANGERVHTGHADGKITINLREADSVEREKSRQAFNESHRTLIGHFRHEIGHYYWQMLVDGRCVDRFRQAFGDHENPDYATAMDAYYQNGPTPDWNTKFISAYASMHPWEDFAETFCEYLGIMSLLDTARDFELLPVPDIHDADFHTLVNSYRRIGIVTNELNREMGLIDLVPDPLVPAVVKKLEFIHALVCDTRKHLQQAPATV